MESTAEESSKLSDKCHPEKGQPQYFVSQCLSWETSSIKKSKASCQLIVVFKDIEIVHQKKLFFCRLSYVHRRIMQVDEVTCEGKMGWSHI